LDSFYEASNILGALLIEDIKTFNPELADELSVQALKNIENLKRVEVETDKSKELQSILIEINEKIEEVSSSLIEKPMLEKMKKDEEKPNTFKKPMFESEKPIELGSFGKGKKRTHQQTENDSKVSNELNPEQKEREISNDCKKNA
jgi:chromatin remodeling complex protein RSC6